MITILFIVFSVSLIIGVPVVFSLGIGCISAIVFSDAGLPLVVIAQRLANSMDSFPLLAVPLFILLGEIMNFGNNSKRIVDFSESIVGSFRGGLSHANVLASMFFGGISGSATADTAAIGGIMIPAMTKAKYSVEFSAIITCTSSIIGVIIPPSVNMIYYAWITETPINKLFAGGFLPGILIGISLMILGYFISAKNNYGVKRKFSLSFFCSSFKEAALILIMPLIILGGIFAGVFTATESAAIAVFYGFFISIFCYKEMKIKDLPGIFYRAINTCGSVLMIIAFASVLGWILTYQQVPLKLATFFINNMPSPTLFLFSTLLISLIVGTFLTPLSALIILTPVLYPVAMGYGLSPIHYGLVLIASLSLGHITPPVGLTLYLASSLAKVNVTRLLRPLIPFFSVLVLVVLLLIFIPEFSTYLPGIMIK